MLAALFFVLLIGEREYPLRKSMYSRGAVMRVARGEKKEKAGATLMVAPATKERKSDKKDGCGVLSVILLSFAS